MVKNKILKRIVAGLSCIALSTTMLTSLPAFADDYVDEYQYYSTLDPNGEEYQEWKSNLASSAVSVPQNRMLKSILKNNTLIANDYIEFNTASNGHYTIGTIGGNPNSSTDDNKKMLFGHPGGGTSKTTIVVGESINEFTSSNVTYDADGSKSVSKASYDGVDVTQELSIIENSATGRDDVVKIKYIVKNDTEYAKQVGIRIMMDTMLGGNDAAPFRVNGSDVTTETVYSGSNIPQIWQAFDSATNPGVVAQGTFYKSGDRKPDKVQFTNWGNVTSTLWDYVTQPGRSNGDSAVSITWNKDTFTSGETREFVTYYGLSELEQNLIPPLALSVYADNKVSISNFNYDDINANVYLDNIGDGDATDVSIKITADNLEPKYGTSLTHNYSVIKPSKSYSIPLKFIVPTDSKHNSDINAKLDFELSYKVAKTGDTEVKRITKNITIPKLKRAVVVVPGIMGIDLAKTSNDESVWGSWIEQPSNFDDVKKIHNAFQSLKCDYYGNSNIELYPVNNYGYDDTYKGIIESLNNDTDISDKYDILFFPYDWRMGAQITANNLHDLISDYNEVVFVAHSMGGIVTEKYISEYGADNISKQITAGTPFWGAPTMLCVLSTGDLSYIIGGLGVAESLFTSFELPILLAQFADDNYDCKINSLADQNTDIMCNIDGNIYLYTNISVNSGSVLFLNLSDGSFFINIDLDNDGEIDTTVTPTINPGVIQDDEKSPEITVESCNAGISNSNTINPNIVITNNSDKPLKMSDITINYVFNADNKENLEYHCDWLAVDNQYLGNTSVCEFVNDDYGNTYAKIKFNTDVELQPNKQFVIHFRLNAADWSNWDTSNDYSMGTEQLLPNDKIIVFYNEQLISGVQP